MSATQTVTIRQTAMKGGIYLVGRQFVSIGLKIIGVMVITRLLGPSGYGTYVSAFSVYQYTLMLGQAGVGIYLLREDVNASGNAYGTAYTMLLAMTIVLTAAIEIGRYPLGAWMGIEGFPQVAAVMMLALPFQLMAVPATVMIERTLNYKAIGDGQATSSYTITLDIAAVNDAPLGSDTSLSAVSGLPTSGHLPPAIDPEGDPVTYGLGRPAGHGTVTINADGTFTYTPTAGYSGADSFVYTLSDGTDVSSFTVFVTVNPGAGNGNPSGPRPPLERDPPVVLPQETAPTWQPMPGDAPLSGGTTSVGSLMGNLNGMAGVITENGPILDVVNAIHPLNGIGSLPDRGAVLDSVRQIGQWIESGRRIDELTAGFFKGGSNIHHDRANGEQTWFTVDTIFYKDYLYIMPSSAGGLEGASFGVTLADGKALPNWLQPTAQGLVIGRPPAGQQFIDLRVHGSSKDGVISDTVRIDLHTGAVLDHVKDERTELRHPLFSDVMHGELDRHADDMAALSLALSAWDDSREDARAAAQ